MSTVLVTGASGYIGIHVVRVLLEKGYRVRGTVRSLSNEAKLKPIRECCPGAKYPVEFVEANLTSDDGWDEAVKGVEFIMHVASPFPNSVPKNAEDLIKPATEGTLRVLRAAAAAKGVKRIVLTSSIASVHGQIEGGRPDEEPYDESQYTDLDSPTTGPYEKSKTMAEMAAWDFINGAENSASKIELVTICPGLVIGPTISGDFGTSVEALKRLMDGSSPMVPGITFALCDVRDVAEAHVKAITVKEAAGKRIIITTDTLWMQDISKALHREFSPMGYRGMPLRRAPNFALWLLSFIDSTVAMIYPRIDKVYRFSNERMRNVLGMQPRPVETSIVDTVYALIEIGVLKKTRKYQPKQIDMKAA